MKIAETAIWAIKVTPDISFDSFNGENASRYFNGVIWVNIPSRRSAEVRSKFLVGRNYRCASVDNPSLS
jgi:hypothetical protein